MHPQIFTLQTWQIIFNDLKLNFVEQGKVISSYRRAWRPFALMWLHAGGRSVDDFLRDVANIIRWASINREAFDDRWLLTLSKTKAIDEVKLCPRQHLNYHTKALFMTVCDFEKLSNISFGGCDRKSRQNTSNWVSTRPNAPNTSKGVSKHVQSCMSWGHCV